MDENEQYLSEEEQHRRVTEYLNIEKFIIRQAKELAEKLNVEIEKGNDTAAFMIAMLLAALKDFIDIVLTAALIGLIPGVTYLGSFLTVFLFFFMLGKGWFLKWRLRVWFWVLGFFIDGLPGFSALPINTLLVLYAWRLARKRAEKAKLKLKNLHRLSADEINKLNEDISLLESGDDE